VINFWSFSAYWESRCHPQEWSTNQPWYISHQRDEMCWKIVSRWELWGHKQTVLG